ncbi:hypothetical protein IMCC3317_23270 [Kordia antarctica]|uniref:Glycerophosphoryl diester phosphodiesterase membrane domain-containing protein n=1 Tax=Kordia antarctica TaxID=1218801 RepID=A0A7L4ZL56_9FLAO|nr:hypothetical protein [Kordia antarctica]QHI36956.1 hypothetical protein IMCC3317_23270 [Kordia antarctica]
MNKNLLIEKIENAKYLSFGDIFSESIELFKKVWLQGFIKILLEGVLGILLIILFQVPILLIIGSFAFTTSYMGESAAPVMALPMLVLIFGLMLLAIVGAGVFTMALSAGFYRICKIKDFNEVGSDDYFYYLKRKYFRKMALLVMASIGISIVAMLLCFFPVYFVMIPIAFFTLIFTFNPELSASDIISVGFKIGTKKWGITFALMIVSGFLASLVGGILCVVGVFFTASFSYLPIYFVYKHVIGFDDDYRVDSMEMKTIE